MTIILFMRDLHIFEQLNSINQSSLSPSLSLSLLLSTSLSLKLLLSLSLSPFNIKRHFEVVRLPRVNFSFLDEPLRFESDSQKWKTWKENLFNLFSRVGANRESGESVEIILSFSRIQFRYIRIPWEDFTENLMREIKQIFRIFTFIFPISRRE